MDVQVEDREGEVALVRLVGRFDLASAPEVKTELARAVERGRTQLVVVLGGVGFMDSSGLGALIGGLRVARSAGGDLRIAEPQDQARMILKLTTLDRVLTPYETIEDALATF